MTEVWKDIKGFEGLYKISNYGNVISLHPHNSKRINPTPIKGDSVRGYRRVELRRKGAKRKRVLVHRLVAEAFLSNPKGLQEVNHKDGNKRNNNATNLEWCTRQENMKHATRNGLVDIKKAINANCVPVCQYDIEGKFIKKYSSCDEATRETGASNISECIHGRRKTSGGYIWRAFNG